MTTRAISAPLYSSTESPSMLNPHPSRSIWSALLLLVLIIVPLTAAEPLPFVHPLFVSHGIIQQGKLIPVWGWTTPGAAVTVHIGTQRWPTTADTDGRWAVSVGPFAAADGPLTMVIDGPQHQEIEDLAVGEVWLCAGQSNMFWFLNAVSDAAGELTAANEPGLRLFSMIERSSPVPLSAPEGIVHHWTPCTSQTASNFSAIAYYFGRELTHRLKVPVGLINCSYGGTTAECWMSEKAVAGEGDFGEALDALRSARPALADGSFDFAKSPVLKSKREIPTLAANGMLLPLAGFPIAGVVWYQGESNANRGLQYRRLLPALIADWREQWRDPKLPFVIVQLAGYGKPVSEPVADANGWAGVMDAQARTAATVPGCALACAYDEGDAGDVHPKHKFEVGRRLVFPALALAYGRKDQPASPRVSSIWREGSAIGVRFTDVGTGLVVRGPAVTTFAVQGRDGTLHRATATVQRNAVMIRCPEVADPEMIQFAYEGNPPGELYSSDGLPVVPFREVIPH